MTKAEFLTELLLRLDTLSEGERERFVAYYDEMLSDRMEDGMDEAAAVSSLEPIPVIAQRIISEAGPAARPQKAKMGAASVALIALGSPVWAPLLAALVVVAVALIIVLWALWFSLAAVCVSLLAVGVAGALGSVMIIFSHPASAVFMLGMGAVCAALGLMCYPPLRVMTAWTKTATAKVVAKVRAVRKREVA